MTGPLLAVPNVSEGRDRAVLDAIGAAFADGGADVLDIHADPDHHRAVFTLAGAPGELAGAVLAGAREAVKRIDLNRHQGRHPRVGAVDVAPIVYLDDERRGAAVAEALVLADLLAAELELPVFLYGAPGGGRTRAELRRPGGLAAGPDFGPRQPHPTAGATLVAARPPLIAFNLELESGASEEDAKRIASAVREGGESGIAGVRAIGLSLPSRGGIAQVSCNVEDARPGVLAELVEAVPGVREAELVGLAPERAFEDFPPGLDVRNRRTVEQALGLRG